MAARVTAQGRLLGGETQLTCRKNRSREEVLSADRRERVSHAIVPNAGLLKTRAKFRLKHHPLERPIGSDRSRGRPTLRLGMDLVKKTVPEPRRTSGGGSTR